MLHPHWRGLCIYGYDANPVHLVLQPRLNPRLAVFAYGDGHRACLFLNRPYLACSIEPENSQPQNDKEQADGA